MARRIISFVMSGGVGSRLWPLSREDNPKQFHDLSGDGSMLLKTLRRLKAGGDGNWPVYLIGSERHAERVRSDLAPIDLAGGTAIFEPVGRNTAAAVALAALYALERMGSGALLWVCPSDHLVRHVDRLHEALGRARPVADAGYLLTFGIAPTRAETGYGYIRAGAPLPDAPDVLRAVRFVEKPERAVAEAMLAEGGHFWNSGMFLFGASRILEELEAHAPDILRGVEAAHAALAKAPGGAWQVPLGLYETVPAQPIDRAVMERADRIAVAPCDPGWSDLGSWQALWEQLPRDAAGNAVQGDAVLHEASDCLVHGESRLVACAGVHGLAVIETDDAVLVTGRERSEAVRDLVAALKRAGRSEASAHSEEHRPWGCFKVLHEGPGFKVKEIVVEPGGRLSLQSHEHRAEHWVVVAGAARVTVGEEILTLQPNQSVHIPLGARHRMENPGEVPMHLIEVQCGDYLGEDDIVRYEDVYGRS